MEKIPQVHFCTFLLERNPGSRVMYQGLGNGKNKVVGRDYLTRQATTLLKFAKSTANPQLAAVLVEKAADLKSHVDETTPPPDQSPRAPDVERPA